MNIDTMRVFCSAVQLQSVSRSAAANHVTQSAATQCIRRAEEELGAQLLDRSKRPFVLTPEGQACYEGFRSILDLYDAVEDRVRSLGGQISGRVRVAAIYSVGLHALGKCMQDFMRKYPKAKVRLEYLRPPEVYQAVQSGSADLGIVSYPSDSHELGVIPLRSETMVLACHPGHRLARHDAVSLSQLKDEDFVAFDRDLMIRKEIDRYLRRHSVPVRVAMEFDNIETIKQAVEIGAGISILPEPTLVKETRIGALAAVRLLGPGLHRPVGLVHRKRMAFTPTVARFVELLEQVQTGTLAEAG